MSEAITAVTDLDTLQAYLNSVTLDDLVKQMRAKGITQKAFCAAVGMSTQHLSAVKSFEEFDWQLENAPTITVRERIGNPLLRPINFSPAAESLFRLGRRPDLTPRRFTGT